MEIFFTSLITSACRSIPAPPENGLRGDESCLHESVDEAQDELSALDCVTLLDDERRMLELSGAA